MLNQAAEHLEQGRYVAPFDLVMADEFQDASRARARLCRALVQAPGKHLFAVGDDWQSIDPDCTILSSPPSPTLSEFRPGTTGNLLEPYAATVTAVQSLRRRPLAASPRDLPAPPSRCMA